MAEIDHITLWQANELLDYWQAHPPTHVLVAAYLLGAEEKRRSSGRPQNTLAELKQIIASVGGRVAQRVPDAYRRV